MKSYLALLIVLGVGCTAFGAQPGSVLTPESQRTAFDAAKAAARRNDIVGTERAVVAMARSPMGTFQWHVETTQRLMQVVHDTSREGRSDILSTLVASMQTHLAQADALATTAREKSTAKALAGLVCERFLGDLSLALGNYRAAAQTHPENIEAQRAADRLQRTLENVRSKVTRTGGAE